MFTGGDGGGDGNQPTLQQILERMRKLEQDLAPERALRQMGNPRGTTVPGRGTSATPVVPGRAARDASAITHYNLWAKSMRYYLSVAGLFDVVIGESPRPIVDEEGLVWLGPDRKVLGDEGDVREWDSLNTSACSVLFNSLTRDQQHFVKQKCRSSRQRSDATPGTAESIFCLERRRTVTRSLSALRVSNRICSLATVMYFCR